MTAHCAKVDAEYKEVSASALASSGSTNGWQFSNSSKEEARGGGEEKKGKTGTGERGMME